MKSKKIIDVNPTMMDINTHEFTLGALAYLSEESEKLEKKLKNLNFRHRLLFVGASLAIYYIWKDTTKKLEEIQNKETKPEVKE